MAGTKPIHIIYHYRSRFLLNNINAFYCTRFMRLIATLKNPANGVLRLMLYAADGGVYLFQYTSLNDGPCEFDEFYEDMITAQDVARDRFGVEQSAWMPISDPLPGCQHDWIAPTRQKHDEAGNIMIGQFESVSGRNSRLSD